jgi:hypothetical protein
MVPNRNAVAAVRAFHPIFAKTPLGFYRMGRVDPR